MAIPRLFRVVLGIVCTLALPWGVKSAAAQQVSRIVISQVQVAGGTSGDEFIELHNAGNSAIDLKGFSLVYRAANGARDVPLVEWTMPTPMPPGSYYLVTAESLYDGAVFPDRTYAPGASGRMSANAGGVALRRGPANSGDIVDAVGYGDAKNGFVEGAPAKAPGRNEALRRKRGGCQDTNHGANDFEVVPGGSPRNGKSPVSLCDTTGTVSNVPLAPPPSVARVGVRIPEIQGASHVSPVVNVPVSEIAGVVTATRSNGFYLQDAAGDGNDATSDGIFVLCGERVSVGDSIRVSGMVEEYRPRNAEGSLTVTQIDADRVAIVSRGAALPTSIVIGNGGRRPSTEAISTVTGSVETASPFDPTKNAIDFYESLEGMLVRINDAVAVGPTNDHGEIVVVADRGEWAGPRTARGGVLLRADDANPERLTLDDVLVPRPPRVEVGDRFPGLIIGIVDYSFGGYKLLNVAPLPVAVPGGMERESATPPRPNQLSVATFNVENLAPAKQGDDLTDASNKFRRLAEMVVRNLQAPDLSALEEVQDNNGPVTDTVVDASTTLNRLAEAIKVAGGPEYGWRQIDPIPGKEGGEPGGNIRVAFLFRADRGLQFVDRTGGTSTAAVAVQRGVPGPSLTFSPGRIDPLNAAFDNTRRSLVGEFLWKGKRLFAIANHFSSKGGDDPLFGVQQPPTQRSLARRTQQAEVVAGFVRSLLAADADANVIVLGDLNDFEWSPTVQVLKAAGLTPLIEALPTPERYSYNFGGNAQALDHILVSDNLRKNGAVEYDIVHVNSEFADQVSDHDPQVARFTLR